MSLIKKYLDDNYQVMDSGTESTCELKSNGHYNISGHWVLVHTDDLTDYKTVSKDGQLKFKQCIRVGINNETIRIDVIANDRTINRYSYLQTYEHIPRGEPDKWGYYARSTEEEVVRYLKGCYDQLFLSKVRNDKLNKLGVRDK